MIKVAKDSNQIKYKKNCLFPTDFTQYFTILNSNSSLDNLLENFLKLAICLTFNKNIK